MVKLRPSLLRFNNFHCESLFLNTDVVLSDSKLLLQDFARNSHCESQRILDRRLFLKDLVHKDSFQWVHCSIVGNEHMNRLAKKGALVAQKPTRALSFHFSWILTNNDFKHTTLNCKPWRHLKTKTGRSLI